MCKITSLQAPGNNLIEPNVVTIIRKQHGGYLHARNFENGFRPHEKQSTGKKIIFKLTLLFMMYEVRSRKSKFYNENFSII